ncbi:glycosyltransferase [Leuconostoc lactis]|uniref:glycosyltransferase n=1 Tax=Leuconostoc lactis TaxID=1246 RepID=UPI0028A91EB6|nr:glycosyltransferase [Leuconostoc lactis]
MSQNKNNYKKKVYHFLNTGNYSGAENVVINIALLVDDFEHVYVSPSGPINDILEEFDIRHIIIDKLSVKSTYQIIKEDKPDIVHAHDFRASIIIGINEKHIHQYGGRLISHIHNNDPRMRKYGLLALLYRMSITKFDDIVVVSNPVIDEYVFSEYLRKQSNIVVLKNIVNEEVINKKVQLGLGSNSSDLIFVGRLTEQKDPLKFLEIVKLVSNAIPQVKAKMIGEGPLRREVEEYIETSQLSNNVEMLGFINNPYPYINASKIGVSTSLWEGFGLSVLEEQLLGKPVVATPVGGVPDLITSQSGMLSNSTQEMADEIVKLLTNNEYLTEKSNKAKENAIVINNISKFIQDLRILYGK